MVENIGESVSEFLARLQREIIYRVLRRKYPPFGLQNTDRMHGQSIQADKVSIAFWNRDTHTLSILVSPSTLLATEPSLG